MFHVNNEGKSSLLKVLGGADKLFSSEGWHTFKQDIWSKGKLVIGHGRSATRGNVLIENAHPFSKTFPNGEVLKLVHNGTLDAEQDLEDFSKFAVDSEWIAEMLVRHGPECLSKIRGAMALIWWDEQKKTINFFRNDQRPLHFGTFTSNGDKTFLIASEAAAVRYLADRNGLKPTDKDDVYYFSPMKHYALHFDDLFGDWHHVNKVKEPPAKTWKTPEWNGYQKHNYGDEHVYRNRTYDKTTWDNKYSLTRGIKEDIANLRKGVYRFVEWGAPGSKDSARRLTQYEDYSSVASIAISPYHPRLRALRRHFVASPVMDSDSFWIVLTEWIMPDGTGRTVQVMEKHTSIRVPETDEVIPLVDPVPEKEEKVVPFHGAYIDVGLRKFRPYKKLTWYTPTSATHFAQSKRGGPDDLGKIAHYAQIADTGGRTFFYYENEIDGRYEKDQQVTIEVLDVSYPDNDPQKGINIVGVPLVGGGKQAYYVDVECILPASEADSKAFSTDEAFARSFTYPLIKGTVSAIRLATKEESARAGGAQVILEIKDAAFILQEEEKNVA
jgi:hypothetical protein